MKLAIDIHATQAQIAEIDKRIQEFLRIPNTLKS